MTAVPFTAVCSMLSVDAKTLRQWLKRSNLSLHQSPTDARVKCLTSEQVHLLADLHGRVLPGAPAGEDHKSSETTSQMPPASFHDTDFLEKVARLETQVASQQVQIAHLVLQLLQEREQRTEQRLLTLEAFLTSIGRSFLQPQTPSLLSQHDELPEPPYPRGQRAHLIPLVEYSASGCYVLICPKEGELHIIPDSPEWFAWLASLSSFRFVGPSGRFSARLGSSSRSHGSWYARRIIHQHEYCKYIGINHHVTIARLEHIAATFQNYAS